MLRQWRRTAKSLIPRLLRGRASGYARNSAHRAQRGLLEYSLQDAPDRRRRVETQRPGAGLPGEPSLVFRGRERRLGTADTRDVTNLRVPTGRKLVLEAVH